MDQLTGQPGLQVRVDQEALARPGVPGRHVLEYVEAGERFPLHPLATVEAVEGLATINREWGGQFEKPDSASLPSVSWSVTTTLIEFSASRPPS